VEIAKAGAVRFIEQWRYIPSLPLASADDGRQYKSKTSFMPLADESSSLSTMTLMLL
jgi:hypothetical protein